MRKRKKHGTGRSVSIRGDLYAKLVAHVGQREKGSRGRISKTVDQLLTEWLDTQEATHAR